MPSSMTGYAAAKVAGRTHEVECELKSVNGKACEIKIHGPRDLGAIEIEIARKIRAAFERGTFRVNISVVPRAGGEARFNLDLDLLRSYKNAYEFTAKELGLGLTLDARDVLSLPNAIEFRRAEEGLEWADVEPALAAACEALARARRDEGRVLARDLKARLKVVEGAARKIAARDKERLAEKSSRLRARIDELAGGPVDPARLHQEVALLLDRLDISEEVTRLKMHLKELAAALAEEGPVGKAIDFRLQETLRELNTIASKASDIEISNATIVARGEIEKIREQAQNLE